MLGAGAKHLVYKKDGEGSTIRIGEVVWKNEILQYPPEFSHVDEVLKQLQEFQTKDDDIWLIDYMKSGTNWVISILDLLTNRGIKHFMYKVKHGMVETSADLSTFEDIPSPRIINTHMMPGLIPQTVLDKSRVIVVMRNPKSVAVSMYNHLKMMAFADYSGSFNGFLPGYMDGYFCGFYGNWFEFAQESWKIFKDKPNVLFVFYEELKKEPVRIIQEISNFLGFSHDSSFIKNVADQTSFDKLKQKQVEMTNPGSKGVEMMYRKGTITDWKNHFTVAQNEMFDAVYEDKMKDFPDLKARIQFS